MSALPNVTISSLDLERLERLLETPSVRALPGAALLEAELERADVVEPKAMPNNVITMNATARFVDPLGKTRELTLVYPKDANPDEGKVSILAPVGTALLGLAVGQSIDWTGPDGKPLKLTVLEIVYQPEASGELHR